MCGGDQSGGAGGIRTAEPTRPALHRRDFLDARGREHDALFRACLVPDSRLLGGSPSLLAGKNAGNFADSAAFCKNTSRKHVRIQPFVSEFPMQTSREFFRARRELIRPYRPEQGIWREIDARVPTFVVDNKIIHYANSTK
jgi:hypothetical protein